MSLLSIENLSVSFGDKKAVNAIHLAVGKGEIVALIGESGSGKSLTALSCLGLQPSGATVSGKIFLGDTEISSASEPTLRAIRGKRISMIFQEPMTALNPLHTIGNQIAEMLSQKSSKARITELLEQVGLAHFKDRLDAYPHQLSGGERQRVMIAMAIANTPDLLIADEPTTAVDVTIQKKILELLKKLQGDLGMAILFITHDLTIVRKFADRMAVMKNGEIVEQGLVADIFAAPKHEYTRLLLASEPKGTPLPAPAHAKPLMACEHLNVWFPIKKGLLRRTVDVTKAVNDVTISIPESTTLGVVGESGSGKTTLGFALLRLIKSSGTITFDNRPVDTLASAALRPLRAQMQMVFQDPFSSLNPRMNIQQIIEEGLRVHAPGMGAAERERAVDDILHEVGLSADMKPRFPHEFSGGQRQRISIARVFVLKPKFVVLDEPTSALDLTVQTQIIELLKGLQQKHGLSYMFISHDLRVVRAIAHQIVVMKNGHIVEAGATADIFDHPKQDYTKTLIDAAFLR